MIKYNNYISEYQCILIYLSDYLSSELKYVNKTNFMKYFQILNINDLYMDMRKKIELQWK